MLFNKNRHCINNVHLEIFNFSGPFDYHIPAMILSHNHVVRISSVVFLFISNSFCCGELWWWINSTDLNRELRNEFSGRMFPYYSLFAKVGFPRMRSPALSSTVKLTSIVPISEFPLLKQVEQNSNLLNRSQVLECVFRMGHLQKRKDVFVQYLRPKLRGRFSIKISAQGRGMNWSSRISIIVILKFRNAVLRLFE